MCLKCGFPFVSFLDADKVVGMSKVECSVDASFSSRLEKVGDEWKWIPIFLRDFVNTMEIDAEAEGAILFMDERTGAPCGEEEDQIKPLDRCSSMNSWRA